MLGFKKPGRDSPMSYNQSITNESKLIENHKITPSIRVTNLSKNFEIYENPRNRLKQFILPRIFNLFGKSKKQYFKSFCALKNISFEIRKGETVGIIGRNGAGKSTLLQILCGTLSPTAGNVEINGRVAALLELGAGFNTEFTGRENIYINAGVLGLSEAEINERFEDIVTFADIGDFLEQPVKTYSSGMFVRLAFAVAVHVDADILIIDEALSVGDVYFQAKCMEHMKKLIESGVSVLFVSHDTNSIKSLCSRAIYLEHGKVIEIGSTEHVVEAYYTNTIKSRQLIHKNLESISLPSIKNDEFSALENSAQIAFTERTAFNRIQNGKASFLNIEIKNNSGQEVESINFGQTIIIRMKFQSHENIPTIGLGYHIRDRNGFDVVYSDTGIENCHITDLKKGDIFTIDWKFKVYLREGDYSISAVLSIPLDLSISMAEICDWIPIASSIKVSRGENFPIHAAVYWPNNISILQENS
jgi:lipopolysaccharide transport system ATP-binding protein